MEVNMCQQNIKMVGMSWLLLSLLFTAAFTQELGLNHIATIFHDQNGEDGIDDVAAITVSHDGKNVYTGSSIYGDMAVAAFSRDPSSGNLTFLEMYKDGENGVDGANSAQEIVVSPNDKFVYLISGGDHSLCKNAIACFARDANTGKLTFVSHINWLKATSGGAVSPDSKYLYATSTSNDAVGVFEINDATGELTKIEEYRDNRDGINGLDGATDVAITPDGNHVYVCSFWEHSVAVFSRSQETGLLTFLQYYKDDYNGVSGLLWAQDIHVSPDGNNVYVGATKDEELTSFSRDPNTGLLTYMDTFQDNVNGVDGLDDPDGICFYPGGTHLFVTAGDDESISIFERSLTDGKLIYHSTTIDNEALAEPENMAISPDGKHLYAVSSRNMTGRIAIFGVSESPSLVSNPGNDMPQNAYLEQNYPNPFNAETTIAYHLPMASFIKLKILSLAGQEIQTLISAYQPEGGHRVKWMAKGIPSGIYFYRLQAGDYIETKKLILQK